MKATAWEELMRVLNLSESEARELQSLEQIMMDHEIARFPKSIQ